MTDSSIHIQALTCFTQLIIPREIRVESHLSTGVFERSSFVTVLKIFCVTTLKVFPKERLHRAKLSWIGLFALKNSHHFPYHVGHIDKIIVSFPTDTNLSAHCSASS